MSNLLHVPCDSLPHALVRVGAVRSAKAKHGWRNLIMADGRAVGSWCKGKGKEAGTLCLWRDSVDPAVLASALRGMVADPMVGGAK